MKKIKPTKLALRAQTVRVLTSLDGVRGGLALPTSKVTCDTVTCDCTDDHC